MAYLRKIVYLSEAQKDELFQNQTITVNGVTIDYNENDLYLTNTNSLSHTLTFGSNSEFVFDGSADVTVPTYTGSATWGVVSTPEEEGGEPNE